MKKHKKLRIPALILSALLTTSSITPALAVWEDGSFTGKATGYGGEVRVTVQLTDGNIIDIQAENDDETPSLWNSALAVLDEIKDENSADNINAISGATISSNAIISAAKQALRKAEPGFSEGDGSEETPYLISSAAGLKWFAEQVNQGNDYSGQYIALDQDISLADAWTPIGNKTTPFAGSFDGQGHTVDGMQIGTEALPETLSYAGLFGYITYASVIRNVHLTNVQIVLQTSSNTSVGALVGATSANSSTKEGSAVDRCSVQGSIRVTTAGALMAGGLIGNQNQYAVLTNSGSDVTIEADAGASGIVNAGGLIGMPSINSVIMNCYSLGDIDAEGKANSNAGGLAGTITGIFYNCYAAGTIQNESGNVRLGGICGNMVSSGCAISCYYSTENNNACGNTTVTLDDTVSGKSHGELVSDAFAGLLSAALSPGALENAQTHVPSAITITLDAMTGGISFYDWQLQSGRIVLSDHIWTRPDVDASIFAGGAGTQEDPFQIATEEQLRAFAASLSSRITYSGQYVQLADNIALTQEWMPAGDGEYAFSGTFDGNGKSITDLQIGSADAHKYDSEQKTYFGLFGVLENAVVRNLKINVAIYVDGVGSIYTGGLAGYAQDSVLDSIEVSGNVYGTSGNGENGNLWKANNFTGGMVGNMTRGKMINCGSSASVFGGAQGGIGESGGLIGLCNRALVANCYSTGNISGTARRGTEGGREYEGMAAVGGIAGVFAGTMANCYSTGNTSSETYSTYVGVLTGWVTGIGKLYSSYYNTESVQKIAEQTVNPVEYAGWQAGAGVNDEGEAYSGSISYQITGLTAQNMNTAAFAELLDAGLAVFPVDLATDWGNVALNQWEFVDGFISPTGAAATITYVKPEISQQEPQADYYDGAFLGRSNDKSLIVQLNIHNGTLESGSVLQNSSQLEVDDMLNTVIEQNGVVGLTGTDGATIIFKEAVTAALHKASQNDMTGYGLADNAIFAGGSGTKANPYRIETEAQLRAFAAAVNVDESFAGKYIQLQNDITLTQEWRSVGGNAPHAFRGVFDGNHKTISNLYMGSAQTPSNARFAGLFSYLESATVQNLTLDQVEIYTGNSGSQKVYAAGLAAAAGALHTDPCHINGVSVNGMIVSEVNTGASYIGATIGQLETSTLTNCSADVTLSTQSLSGSRVYAGGLVGISARSAVVNNIARGSISVSSSVNKTAAGGIFGYHSGVAYNNVSGMALTSVKSTADIGGIAGRNTGIALMLDGYYSATATQRQGDATAGTNVGVGAAVSGENAGRGAVEGMTSFTSESETSSTLNANLVRETQLERVRALLSLWNVSVPDSIQLYPWISTDGILQINLTGNGVSLARTSTSSGSNSSGNSSGTKTTYGNDGSVIRTETDSKTGTITTTQIQPNGDKTISVKRSDGTETITAQHKNGTAATTAIAADGRAQSTVTMPANVLSDLSNQFITLPIPAISAAGNAETASSITVNTPEGMNARIMVPVQNVQPGTIAVTVSASGTYKIVRNAAMTENGLQLTVSSGDTILIIDNSPGFTDVLPGSWYHDAVSFAASRELFSGTGDDAFTPDSSMTRAMLFTVLARYDGQETSGGENWYSAAMKWAKENGFSDGTNPDGAVTREQLATILYRYDGMPAATGALTGFSDADTADSWATEALRWSVEKGVIAGNQDKQLNPKGNATRAEVATILMRYINKANG